MDLQNIQEQLNMEFAKESTRIIFWFDDKCEYEDEVAELCLDNATLIYYKSFLFCYKKIIFDSTKKRKYSELHFVE